MYVLYIGLLLSALNRLPLKLPQKTAGRRHQQKAQDSVPVCFDDVCGVDEAKEELAEIVVRKPCVNAYNANISQVLDFARLADAALTVPQHAKSAQAR